MTTIQILFMDECRDNGRARADERLCGNRYVMGKDKRRERPRDVESRELKEVVI